MTDEPTYMLIRSVPGVVGTTRRVVHLVRLPEPHDPIPRRLVAECGASYAPGTAERVDRISGMPCERCLGTRP